MSFRKSILLPFFFRVFFILIFFAWRNAGAQFYQVRNFNSENGLPSPEAYGLMQDSKGYMWFATDMGISRYNGYEFKNFSTENGLPDNTVFGFFEDAKGRIWIRSFSGKLSYFFNDSIYVIPCNQRLEKEIKKNAIVILSIYVDEADVIWMGTSNSLVLKIFPPWSEKDVEWIHVPAKGEYAVVFNNKNLVYGGGYFNEYVVTVFGKDMQKIIEVKPGKELVKDRRRKLFVTRLRNGNFLASADQVMTEFNMSGIVRTAEKNENIIGMIQDKDNKIITVSYDGVCFHDPDDFSLSESIPDFSNKIITGVLIDRENALWLSVEGNGVYYIPFRSGRYYTTKNGLPQSKISCIGQKNGKIVTGHLNGSVSVINANEIKNTVITSQKPGASNRAHFVYTGEKENVYVGSNFDIYRLSGKNFETCSALNAGSAKKIIPAEKNNSTYGQNDTVWTVKDRHIVLSRISENFKPIKELLFNQYIDDVFEDSKGVLWIGGLNGLWSYSNDALQYLGEKNKLFSARIIDMGEDNKGRLWMATRGEGVIVKDENKLYQVKQADGLASNMCRDLFIDSNSVVWVGSNNGLSRIKTWKEASTDFAYDVEVFSNKHGLLTNEVNYIVPRGKELLLAHNNGISIFNPSSLKKNISPPPVYIISTTVNNKTYKENSLQLDYSRNYLKINYVGLSYKNPGSVEYKYKMEGLDTSWVYTNYTSAQFQTLNPGAYKFIVYARNDDGYWSSSPAILQLEILPAWWQTWVFRIFSGLFLFALVYFFVRKRINRIRKREQEKNILQGKVSAAELKALRAQMNPHFVFNAINSVQHFITSNDPDSSQRYLSKFARLIRYVVDNSKPTAIPLEKELEAIRLFMDIEALRFEKRFEYEIVLDEKIDAGFVHVPSMLIQPYIENAIWHGLMHKEGKGKIKISIQMLDQLIKCTIEDNGVGRKKSLEFKSVQKIKTHKSVGMTITQERLELINQMNNSRLSVRITDLTDENGNALGTRVELFIPSN